MHWFALFALAIAAGGFLLGSATAWVAVLSLSLRIALAVLASALTVAALLRIRRRRG